MVVVGYQGIGKSTLTKQNVSEGCYTATLEYEWMKVDGHPIENFFQVIQNIAEHLKGQHITTVMAVDEFYSEIMKTKIQFADHPVFIDLESSNFWVNGERSEDWAKVYAKLALELSKQGFIVFTSSHKVVRDELDELTYEDEYYDEDVVVVYPSLSLKDEWIEKLRLRYESTKLDKDYRAYMNAKEKYEENISELMENPFDEIILSNIDYNLREAILEFKENM